jgi:hypothetical protein
MNSINQHKDMHRKHHTVEGTARHENKRQAKTHEKCITSGGTDEEQHEAGYAYNPALKNAYRHFGTGPYAYPTARMQKQRYSKYKAKTEG